MIQSFKSLVVAVALLVSAGSALAQPFGPPNAVQNNVEGTTYAGSETLSNPGNLIFEFKSGGAVIMTDDQSKVKGTYTVNGNQVEIQFSNCVYVGQIQGNQYVGTAASTQGQAINWAFSVTLQK